MRNDKIDPYSAIDLPNPYNNRLFGMTF